MLLYLDNYKVIAYNESITKADSAQYVDGVSCIWVDDLNIEFPPVEDNQKVDMYFNGESIDYIITDIETEVDKTEVINTLIEETRATTQIVADDNIINMDMLLEVMTKVDMILNHLGL